MTHAPILNLWSSYHRTINDALWVGICLIVLSKDGIGHKNLIRSIMSYFVLDGLTAVSVAVNLYRGHFDLAAAIVREGANCLSTVAIGLFAVGIADVVCTLRDSETITRQQAVVKDFLHEEQNRQICDIERVSRQQNEYIGELVRGGSV